jgi:hypothetical protein
VKPPRGVCAFLETLGRGAALSPRPRPANLDSEKILTAYLYVVKIAPVERGRLKEGGPRQGTCPEHVTASIFTSVR